MVNSKVCRCWRLSCNINSLLCFNLLSFIDSQNAPTGNNDVKIIIFDHHISKNIQTLSTLKALTTLIGKPGRLKALLSYGHKGYLNSIGWFTAFDQQQAVDGEGKALPWVTYSFIDFIRNRINQSHHIFEYGSGNSTIFYAEKSASVTSVEHDQNWYNKVKGTSPANAEMIFCELQRDGEYARKATLLNKKFDIIIPCWRVLGINKR